MSKKSTLLLALGFLLIIGISNVTFSGIPKLVSTNISETSALPGRTPRPLQKTRSVENPISSEAVLVPESVSTIKKQNIFSRLLNKPRTYKSLPDTFLPVDLRKGILVALTSLVVDEVLSPDQVRNGGPAVIERLRSGNVAFFSPSILGVYFNEEAGQGPGIGGGLISSEPWTGPSTATECGIGFYEVVEVSGTEYCDVVRYDFYDPDDLNASIAIAASVTEEQYCDSACTQPSCKAVCESLIPQNDPGNLVVQVQYEWRDLTPLPPSGITPPRIVPSPSPITPVLPPAACSLHDHPNPPYGAGGNGVLENDGNFGNDDPTLVRHFQQDMNDLKAAGIGFTFTCSSALSGCSGSNLVVDGLFGVRTASAALAYETWRNNVTPGACGSVNGVVDGSTWQCLAEDMNRIECSAPPPPPPSCTLHPHTNPPYGAGGQGTLEYDPWNGTPTHWNNDTPSLVLDFQNDINFLSGSGTGFVLSCTATTTCDCGATLCEDGLFGPKTRDAAVEYETWRNSVTPGACGAVNGIIDAPAWQCLTEDIETLTCPLPPPPSTITVLKDVTNTFDGTAVPADFTVYVGANALSSGDTVTVAPGDHFVTEDLIPGYTFSGFSGDCDSSGKVTVAPGGNATCTILNSDLPEPASITVTKTVINDSGRSASASDFTLYIGDVPVTSGTTLQVAPGTHVITEDLLTGYVFTGFSGDCDANGRVTLAPGESVTCTLTNDDIPVPPPPLNMDGTSTIVGYTSSVAINLATSFESPTDAIVSNADPAEWTSDLDLSVLDEDGLLITYSGQPEASVSFNTSLFSRTWSLQELSDLISPQIFSIGPFQEIEINVETLETPGFNEALNVAYFWDSETNTCGCGAPIYTSSCIDSTGDGTGDACVQVPGGDGQSTCATQADCQQTYSMCNTSGQCVVVAGSGINGCDSDIDCRPQQHSACLGSQCVIVPEPGEDTCSVDTDCTGEVPSRRACITPQPEVDGAAAAIRSIWLWGQVVGPITNTGNVTMDGSLSVDGAGDIIFNKGIEFPDGNGDSLDAQGNPTQWKSLVNTAYDGIDVTIAGDPGDTVTFTTPLITITKTIQQLIDQTSPIIFSIDSSKEVVLDTLQNFPAIGPQCATVGCTAFEVLAGLCVDTCSSDNQCGFVDSGPSGDDAISSTEQLVDFPQPITGSEFNPPPLPPLGDLGGTSCVSQNTAVPIDKNRVATFNTLTHSAAAGWHDNYACGSNDPACSVDLAVGTTCSIGVSDGAGLSISSPIDGKVSEVFSSPFGFGQCVVVSTGGVLPLFALNAGVLCGINSSVAVGDSVTAGSPIGTLNTSGYFVSGCTDPIGPNLHFELKLNNEWITTNYTGSDLLEEAKSVWSVQASLLESSGCPLTGGSSFATCGVSSGGTVYDQCLVGGTSGIACGAVDDCLRLEHSQCAADACVVVPGPGINQCGNPNITTSLSDATCSSASSCDSSILAQQIIDLEAAGKAIFRRTIVRTAFENTSNGINAPVNGVDGPACVPTYGPNPPPGGTPLNPLLLQLIIKASEIAPPTISNLANGEHACGSAHYFGDAADLTTTQWSCSQKESFFKYLYDNRQELQIGSLIHFFRNGSIADDGKAGTTCTRPAGTTNLFNGVRGNATVDGHNVHIHVSVDPNGVCL